MSELLAKLTLKANAKEVVTASNEAKAALNNVKGAANDVTASSKGVSEAQRQMGVTGKDLAIVQRDVAEAAKQEARALKEATAAAMGASAANSNAARAATGAGVAHTGAAKAAMGASTANTNLAGTSKSAQLAMTLTAAAAGGLIGAMNPLELAVIAVGWAYKAYKDEMDVAARSSAAQAQMVATLSPLLATYKSETDKAAEATGRLAWQHRDAANAARDQMQATLDAARMDLARARAAVRAAEAEAQARLEPSNMTAGAEMGTGVLIASDMARADSARRKASVAEAALSKAEDELVAAGVARRSGRRGGARGGVVLNDQRGTISDYVAPAVAKPEGSAGSARPRAVSAPRSPRADTTGASPLGQSGGRTGSARSNEAAGPSQAELAAARAIQEAEDKRNAAIARRNELIAEGAQKGGEEAARAYLSEESAARLLRIQELMAPLLDQELGFSQAFLEAELDRTAAIVDGEEAERARLAAIKATAYAAAKAIADEKTLNDARAAATGRLTDMRAEEALLAGKTRAEVEVIQLVEAEINRLKEAGVPLTEAQIEAERRRLTLLAQGVVEARKTNEMADRATRRMEQAADDVQDAWENAWERMLDGSLDGFEDFGKALVKMWKAQILRQIMQRIQVPVEVTGVGGTGGGAPGTSGSGGIAGWLEKIFGQGKSDGTSGSWLNGLKSVFTNGAKAFETSAQGVGTSFEKLAVSFGAKAGGSLAKAANFGGQAFAGYQAGAAVSDMVGLKGNKSTTAQGIGDAVFAGIGQVLGGPVGAAIGTMISRAIGGALNDKDYAYARSDVVVRNGQFSVASTDVHDGGDGAAVSEAAGGLAIALNEAAKLFKLDLSKEDGAYSSFGYTTGRFGIGAGFFGGAVKTSSGVYDQTSDALGTGRKGRSNLEAVGTQYGQVVMNQADAAVAATEIVKDTIIRMAERAGSAYSAAEIAVIKSAQSIEEAAAKITRGREFSQSLTDMIQEITDPALAARRKAIKAVEDQISALKDEASGLIGAGLVSADVLTKIDKLKDLKLAETMAALANAANGAVNAFEAAAPRLRDWLDKVRISDVSQVSPGEARARAYASYERVLEKARAGDADALGQVTGYADALLAADRSATDNAQARLALFNQVTGAVEGLTSVQPEKAKDPLEELLKATKDGLEDVTKAVDGLSDTVEDGHDKAGASSIAMQGAVRDAVSTSSSIVAGAVSASSTAIQGAVAANQGGLTAVVYDAGIDRLGGRYNDANALLVQRWDGFGSSYQTATNALLSTWDDFDVNSGRFVDSSVTLGAQLNAFGNYSDVLGLRLGNFRNEFDWPELPTVDVPVWTWPELPGLRLPELPTLEVQWPAYMETNFSDGIVTAVGDAADYQVEQLGGLLRATISRLETLDASFDDLAREQSLTNARLRAGEAQL